MNYEKDLLVSSKKEIVVKDACILFDLVDLNLLGDFFQLEFFAMTTPEVIAEITNEIQWTEISKYVENKILIVDGSGEFQSIADLFDEHPGLSITDSSVLELAIRKEAIIFSSDGSLRKISTNKNLTVRGILWIIEELYNKNIMDINTTIEKLKQYAIINQRAPVKEIENLINKLVKT